MMLLTLKGSAQFRALPPITSVILILEEFVMEEHHYSRLSFYLLKTIPPERYCSLMKTQHSQYFHSSSGDLYL